MYLILSYLGKRENFLESEIKDTVKNMFDAARLRITHFTREQLIGIYKDVTSDPEKKNIIYKFKIHCDRVYVGRPSQGFHLGRGQHIIENVDVIQKLDVKWN